MGNHLGEITKYLWRQSWQLAVLIVAVAVVCSILRNRSAHVRYLLWLIVLAKCVVPPFLTVPLAILPAVQRAESPARLPVAGPLAVPGVPNEVSNRSMATPSISVETDTAQPKTSRFSTAFADQVLAAIWIIGMAVVGCIAVAKVLRSTLRLRQQRKLLPNDLQTVVGELLSDFGMRTHPKVWVLNGIGQPFVWGLLRGISTCLLTTSRSTMPCIAGVSWAMKYVTFYGSMPLVIRCRCWRRQSSGFIP